MSKQKLTNNSKLNYRVIFFGTFGYTAPGTCDAICVNKFNWAKQFWSGEQSSPAQLLFSFLLLFPLPWHLLFPWLIHSPHPPPPPPPTPPRLPYSNCASLVEVVDCIFCRPSFNTFSLMTVEIYPASQFVCCR